MNISFFTHYTGLYGANRSLINLVDGLHERGFNIFLVAPSRGPITEYFLSKGYHVLIHPLSYFLTKQKPKKVQTLKRLEQLLKNLPILTNQLKKWGIDLVYTNSSVIDAGIISASAIKKPHIWHIREFGDLDYGLHPDIGKPLFHKLLCASDGLIFISNALKSHILPSINNPNISVIYNGIAREGLIKEIYQNNKKSTKLNITSFSIVGLVTKNKGQHIAISSFIHLLKKHPNTKLFIAGDGDLLWKLKSFVYDSKLYNNIIFLENIIEPLGLFMNTDVALMCSDNEAMGRVTAEAMSCLCPVIGKNSGANPEIITPGQTGYLYETPEELSSFMCKMINNPSMTRDMGEKAWEQALQKYTVEKYTNDVIKVIKSVCDTSRNNSKTFFYDDESDQFLKENNEPYWSIYEKFLN